MFLVGFVDWMACWEVQQPEARCLVILTEYELSAKVLNTF